MTTQPMPDAWAHALEQFEGAYGSPPDLSYECDLTLFIELLHAELRAGILIRSGEMYDND